MTVATSTDRRDGPLVLQDPASIQVNCDLHPLIRAALENELQRERNASGDLEPGEALDYVIPIIHSSPTQPILGSPCTTSSNKSSLLALQKTAPAGSSSKGHSPATSRRNTTSHLPSDSPPVALPRNTGAVRRRRRQRADKRKVQAGEVPRYKLRSSAAACLQTYRVIKRSSISSMLPVARGAYVGLRAPKVTECKTVEELTEKLGYEYIAWDGIEPTVLESVEGHSISVLVGGLQSEERLKHLREFNHVMTCTGKMLRFRRGFVNRRGQYSTVSFGISYGGRRTLPGNLHLSKINERAIDEFVHEPAVRRVSGRHNAAFAQYGQKLFTDYRVKLSALYQKLPALKRYFEDSVFPAASCNFGPGAVTCSHVDHCNHAVGWCAIFAAGEYDPKCGGHIVLESYRLIIEFPPRSSILIPSASCVHSNTPIRPGESRMAFTQYAAGGLFHFVDYGFRSWKTLQAEEPEVAQSIEAERDLRWARELKPFSRTSELHEDRKACGITR